MLPKMATEQAHTMIVVLFAPSHTIRTGANADLGSAFKITKYGSNTLDKVSFHQNSVATKRLPIMTMTNPINVSYKVIPI